MIYRFSDDCESVDGEDAGKETDIDINEQNEMLQKYMYVNNDKEAGKLILEQLDFHFMFNAMNTIKAMTLIDAERVRELIDDLASVMRYRMRMLMDFEMVSLREEFKQAKCFASLEMGRYSKIQIEVAETTAYGEVLIPGLTVVSLVENAVRHGLRGKSEGGLIKVYFGVHGDECIVSVEDNGVGFTEPEMWLTHSGEFNDNAYPSGGGMNICSLRQVKERVENMAEGSLCIGTDSRGTLIEIHLPVK